MSKVLVCVRSHRVPTVLGTFLLAWGSGCRIEFDPAGPRIRMLLYHRQMPFAELEEVVHSPSSIFTVE